MRPSGLFRHHGLAGRRLLVTLATAIFGWASAALGQSAPLDLRAAQSLIEQGRAADAWRLLAPHEKAHAGEQEFDFLLGVAALESGRPNIATFVLERVLLSNPNHSAARFEIGRAYFQLGDDQRARPEFEMVLRFDPQPGVRASVERYLAAIDARASGPRVRMVGYVETAVGYDSNVNASTSQSALFVPAAGGIVPLAPLGTKRSDSFVSLGAGLEFSYPLARTLAVILGVDLHQRMHRDVDAFDSRSADLRVGLRKDLGDRDRLRVLLAHNEYDLDNASYRRTDALTLEWARQHARRMRYSLFGQGLRFRYPPAFARANGSDMTLYGSGAAFVLDEASRALLHASVYVAQDRAAEDRADGDRGIVGLRAGYQRAISPRADGFAAASWQRSDYERRNVFFATERRDRQYDLSVGIVWRLTHEWSLRPALSWTRNKSNIAVNDYDRLEASLLLRRTWN